MTKFYTIHNKSRAPLIVELSAETHKQEVLLIGRDPKENATGPMRVERTFPRSVTVAAKTKSEPVPLTEAEVAEIVARGAVVTESNTPAAPEGK